LKYFFHFNISNFCLLIAFIAKQNIVSNLPTTKKSHPFIQKSVKPLPAFLYYLADKAPFPISSIGIIGRNCTSYAIGKNSLSGLKRCVQEISFRPFSALGAAAVHLLNAGLELGSIAMQYLPEEILEFSSRAGFSSHFENFEQPGYESHEEHRDEDNFFKNREPLRENCRVPRDLSTTSNVDLASHPKLDPKHCLKHAKIIMQGVGGQFDEARFAQEKCAYVNFRYRDLAMSLHPDRGGTDRAFTQLTAARDALGCEKSSRD
jgi:hypothetical protein